MDGARGWIPKPRGRQMGSPEQKNEAGSTGGSPPPPHRERRGWPMLQEHAFEAREPDPVRMLAGLCHKDARRAVPHGCLQGCATWMPSGLCHRREAGGDVSAQCSQLRDQSPASEERLQTQMPKPCSTGFPGGSVVKNPPASAGSIPESGRPPGEGNTNPFQYSCLENPHGQRSLVGYNPCGHKSQT